MKQLAHHECVRVLVSVAEILRSCVVDFADRETLRSFDHSIEQSKLASNGSLPRSDLDELASTATRLTGQFELWSNGIFLKDSKPERELTNEQLKALREVADVVARAVRATTGTQESANQEYHEGISWAFSLTERLGDRALHARIQAILDQANSA